MERQNPWWTNEPDIKYRNWLSSEVRWVPSIIDRISTEPFSLHILTGPRQVGKTTAIKILIHMLLEERDPRSIFYYSCDEITDYLELGKVLDAYLASREALKIKASIIFLDEITYVEEWWRALKSRIDLGRFEEDVIVVTGSASLDLLKQKERFPGRRGKGRDLVLYPLDFASYARILGGLDLSSGDLSGLEKNRKANELYSRRLKELFSEYLQTGGFPISIQDLKKYGKVSFETVRTYLDWLRGDWAKAGKSDRFMKEILSYLLRAAGTPISWNSISTQTCINSPNTVRTYIETLEGIHSLLVLNLMTPDKQVKYRKNKKVHFTDPFIFRVMEHYLDMRIDDDWIFEATVASHLARMHPVYYWRGRTEVDVVCEHKNEPIGFEVTKGLKKWKAPRHIKRSFLLDRENIYIYLSALKTS